MIRVPVDMGRSEVVNTTYAHVASVARLPHVRYRERDGMAYAVRWLPAARMCLVYSAPIPGSES